MAIKTLGFASFGGGAVVVDFDYNDQNGNVTKFRCTNNSPYLAYFRVIQVDPVTLEETQIYARTCTTGVTTQNVAGLTLEWETEDHDGDGIPDGGLNMGNYQFQARWPA